MSNDGLLPCPLPGCGVQGEEFTNPNALTKDGAQCVRCPACAWSVRRSIWQALPRQSSTVWVQITRRQNNRAELRVTTYPEQPGLRDSSDVEFDVPIKDGYCAEVKAPLHCAKERVGE